MRLQSVKIRVQILGGLEQKLAWLTKMYKAPLQCKCGVCVSIKEWYKAGKPFISRVSETDYTGGS